MVDGGTSFLSFFTMAREVLLMMTMKAKAIDRNVPMVIFLTAVILVGLVTAGRDQAAAERVKNWFANGAHLSIWDPK